MAIRVFDATAPAAVVAFLDDTVSRRGRAHWHWKYGANGAATPSAFFWEEPDGRVLGFIGLMRTALHMAQEQHPAAWFVDWHVTPGERGVGVGLGLLRTAEAAAGMLLTLQGSADTRQILPRLGWKESHAPATWVRPLSARFLADRIARRMPAWMSTAAPIVSVAASRYFRCRAPAARADVALIDVPRLPADYDTAWERRRAEFAPAMTRNSASINHLCADYPDGGYRLQLLRARQAVVGHLLTRIDDTRGFRRGRIVDCLWPRAQTKLATWLIESACWQLQKSGADYVECVVSVSDLAAAARRNRFRCRGTVPLWYHRLPTGAPNPDSWYITLLDCDRAYR